jgi:hypothetical protein
MILGVSAASEESTSGMPRIAAEDTLSRFEGKTIDSIAIEPRNIYDTDDPEYRGRLFRLANSLHIVTRKKIVMREALFRAGDVYSTRLAEEVGRNLRASHALNDAWVAPEEMPDGRLLVRIVTVDRWSLVGGAQIRRDGNVTNYRFGFEERNLLGYHQFMNLDYYVQRDEDDYVAGKFTDRRLWGFPILVQLSYTGDPLGSSTGTLVSHPYYSLSQRWSYSVQHALTGGRSDFYVDTIRVASTNLKGDHLAWSGKYRWGPSTRKFAIGAQYEYQYKAYYDDVHHDSALAGQVVLPLDSLYHKAGGSLEFSSYEFARTSRLNGMSYLEDLTLGFSAELGFARAFGPHIRGVVFDDVSMSMEYSARFGASIVQTSYEKELIVRESATVRNGDRVALRYYNNGLSFVTLAVRTQYRSESMADGSNRLFLGGTNGLRGYDKFFRTGDRMHIVNSELRFFPQIKFLSLLFGGAVFADVGRTWKHGESLKLFDGYHSSAGVGIRVSLEKFTRGDVIRFDLARTAEGNWQVSADSHQYF